MGLAEGAQVSRYRIVRPLGAGQMGEVYLATAPNGEQVAIKIMRTVRGADTELLARFRREASVSQSVLHPNVVVVFEHGEVDGSPFLVMPYFRGEDFASVLVRTGALKPAIATSIVRSAALGLEVAHASGIIHRDFKPANLFLDERGDEIVPVVCDFGIAKTNEGSELTASGAVLGTPLYMAPEQFLDSKRVTPRADVWALGMTLYHALAGRAAYEHIRTMPELMMELAAGRVPPLQSLAPWVQPGLARVVHAALLPQNERLPSVRAFVDALDQWSSRPMRLTRGDLVPIPEDEKSRHAVSASSVRAASELGTASDATVQQQDAGDPNDPFIGRVIAQRYRIVAPLGVGGMGTVYEALDVRAPSNVEASVALKLMHPESGPRGADQTRRFLREAKASQRVQHPNVTRVVDTGVDAAGAPYLAMERLRGMDLARLIGQPDKMLAPNVVFSLFVQACEGLAAAHALGIVHRDIKPSNLFVHEQGDLIVLKVCDFGIAKQLADGGAEQSAELTQTGGLLGSPLYMSPEQAKSAKGVDARSDVYSLALSLHEALSGMRPWTGKTSMGEIILAVCTEDLPPLHVAAPWLDPQIARIVQHGVERDRERRMVSVTELSRVLRPFALARPITRADLTLLPRPKVNLPQASESAHSRPSLSGSGSMPGRTADPVSYTDSSFRPVPPPPPASKTPWVLAAAAVVVAAVGTAGVVGGQKLLGARAPAAALVSSSAPELAASSTMAPAPPSASPSASAVEAEPAKDAGPPKVVTKPAVVGTKPAPVIPAATSAAPASNVGRGVTATDLPP